MGEIVYREQYLQAKIDDKRQEMQSLMESAVKMIDEAKEGKYDFSRVAKAMLLLDKAVILNKEIKRLELKLVA